MLRRLEPGTTILSASGEPFTVTPELAAEFVPGDSIIANRHSGLLRIPAAEREIAHAAVAACTSAFDAMDSVTDAQIVDFFHKFAAALGDDSLWAKVKATNDQDVAEAKANGRSTTRLAVSEAMRNSMIEGLQGWAETPSRRDAILETIPQDDFRIELVGSALGVVAFVFEGRPNVLADACGVLRGGNTAIFRIGKDALATARTMMQVAVQPALVAAGMPAAAITLIDSPAHSAGWSLFLDDRLSLAIARGSGPAVDLLGSLAQSVGTPVSLHGTGGAWLMAAPDADAQSFEDIVVASLDRKVCNTLNTCCVLRETAETMIPTLLTGLQRAAAARNTNFKLHVVESSKKYVPTALFSEQVSIGRANGVQQELQAETLAEKDLAFEWEWEDSPELTLVVVDSVDAAVDLFNQYSPRLVASLVSDSAATHQHFWNRIRSPFVGDGLTRWVDGQYALAKPELGLSNWANGRLFGRGAILTGDSVYTVRTRYVTK